MGHHLLYLALFDSCCPSGKGGHVGVREGRQGGGQGRGSFLKERKPGSLGTEKARVPRSLLMASCPLLLLQPTPGMGINRDFALSLSLSLLGKDWAKEAKNKQPGVGSRRDSMGCGGTPWPGSYCPQRNATGPEEAGIISFLKGSGGQACWGLGWLS